jgi:hypothetical protein
MDMRLLVPLSSESHMETDELKSASIRSKRSFAAFNAAKAKLQPSQAAVHGAEPAVLPVHPSHAKAIQEAINASASFSSSGRTEMWPLQLLEGLARQHTYTSSLPPGGAAVAPIKPSGNTSRNSFSKKSQSPVPASTSSSRTSAAPAASGPTTAQPRPSPPTSLSKPRTNGPPSIAPTDSATAASFTPPAPSLSSQPMSSPASSSLSPPPPSSTSTSPPPTAAPAPEASSTTATKESPSD